MELISTHLESFSVREVEGSNNLILMLVLLEETISS